MQVHVHENTLVSWNSFKLSFMLLLKFWGRGAQRPGPEETEAIMADVMFRACCGRSVLHSGEMTQKTC